MTVTSVKDVGSMLSSLTTNVAAKSTAQIGSVSFQSVWNSQTEGGGNQASAKMPDGTQSAAKPGDSLKAKEPQTFKATETTDDSSQTDETGKSQEDIENLEEAMEVLGTVAVELLNRIADTLGIDPKQLQDALSEMELEPVDLLDSAVLSTFLLKVGGAEDSMALLTNEELYQDFNQLMSELEGVLSEESGIGEMNLEELKGQVEQKLQMLAETTDEPKEDAEPIIEVKVEGANSETDVDNAATQEQLPEVKGASEQAKEEDSDKSEERHSGAKEHGSTPFVQNMQPANPNLQNVQSAQMTSAWDVDTQDIMRQIMDYMRIQVKPDMSQLEMQLHPANLGTLQIHVASKGGVLTANFVTQNEAVKAALESQMVQLKENFSEQGVKVEAIEVTVQTHQFEENLEQGQRESQNAPEKKSKTRRIKLDGPLTMEELSDMGQEEQLTAEMMAANGSTVDYTA